MTERRTVRCSCGNAHLKTRPRYGLVKWFLMIAGGTPVPDGKEIYCDRCDEVVASTRSS